MSQDEKNIEQLLEEENYDAALEAADKRYSDCMRIYFEGIAGVLNISVNEVMKHPQYSNPLQNSEELQCLNRMDGKFRSNVTKILLVVDGIIRKPGKYSEYKKNKTFDKLNRFFNYIGRPYEECLE